VNSWIESALIDAIMIFGLTFLILVVHDCLSWIGQAKWQFRLRALLIAVTAASLLFGLVAAFRN
jgi:hypothetical protein